MVGRRIKPSPLWLSRVAGPSGGAEISMVFVLCLVLVPITGASDSEASSILAIRNELGLAPDGFSLYPSMSADGSRLAFLATAPNLQPTGGTDCSICRDIYVRDLGTGAVQLISSDAQGRIAVLNASLPAISGDGNSVVFWARNDPAVVGDDNGLQDWILWQSNRTEPVLVTRSYDGGPVRSVNDRTCEAFCGSASISHDGRYVVFGTSASSLVPGDTNNETDVFRFDSWTGDMVRVSVSADGREADGPSWTNGAHAVSGDGRFVVFTSHASNIHESKGSMCTEQNAASTGLCGQAYRKDLVTGELLLLSRGYDGQAADGQNNRITVSADGNVAAFQTNARNLVRHPTTGDNDVMIVDIPKGSIHHVRPPSVTGAPNGLTYAPDISDDGSRIAFLSTVAAFHPYGARDSPNVFVLDRMTGGVVLVSHGVGGGWMDGSAGPPSISGDGRTVAWISTAKDVRADEQTDSGYDVFLTSVDESIPAPALSTQAPQPGSALLLALLVGLILVGARRRS